MDKKYIIIIGMVLVLGIIGVVFAADALSVGTKDYDDKTKTVTIFDSNEKEIATIRLITPLDYEVGMGYQMVAAYEVTSLEALKILVSEIELYDTTNEMEVISRQIDYKINSTIQVEVNDYEIICKEVWSEINKSVHNQCVPEISGSHYEDRVVWNDLGKVDFIKDEKIIVGLFTYVQKGDIVEWVPTFEVDGHDYKVEEWTTWKESLNTNIVAYYRLENNTDRNDEVNEYDGVGTSDTYAAGHINNALDTGYVTLADQNDFDFSGAFSLSMWYKYSGQTGDDVLIGKRAGGEAPDWFISWDPGDHHLKFYSYGEAGAILLEIVELQDGSYHHVVITRDGSNNWVLYLDNVSVDTASNSRDFTSAASIGIGSLPGGVVNDNTKLDELAFYKGRALSVDDISYIYASTTGYQGEFGPINCWFEEPGKISVPPEVGCKYDLDMLAGGQPS